MHETPSKDSLQGSPSDAASNAGEDVLSGLEPAPLWQCFDGLRRVPRPSKHEEQVIAYVEGWAAEHGFKVRHDDFGNRVVRVPSSPGRESAPIHVLQAHLDMVCEKNAGIEHDFMNDPIRLRRDGDWIGAVGTTLGADNGLGVAAAMAVAIDPEVEHGPLELLFTLDEETGLNGAAALDAAIVEGRRMINLDTEEDDAVLIGCAGAAGVQLKLALTRGASGPGSERYELAVKGLLGGHSGVEIDKPRGNAIKIAARLLAVALEAGIEFELISLKGGSKANAIPRECFCHLRLATSQMAAFEQQMESVRQEVAGEFGADEPNFDLQLTVVVDGADGSPMTPLDRDRLVHLVDASPHGVLVMSSRVPDLVETSNNVAVVDCGESRAHIQFSLRSSCNEALARVAGSLASLGRLAMSEVSVDRGYPGWAPDPDDPLVQETAAAYTSAFGEAPAIKAVHAGLECGILSERLDGLQAVSIGPTILGAHSPDERASISSAARFYRFLSVLLGRLSEPKSA